ncbi:ATPase, partial [Candidatus Parcubacteria bacterium]
MYDWMELMDNTYSFARFWKCALQVNPHSYSGNYRGQEHGMDAQAYAESLRDVCLEEKIQVVGLADHSSVADAEMVRRVLTDAGVVVFPGFEVATTEKVHWVCLFPEDTTEQQLERYLGRLHLTDPEDGVRPSSLGGQELLKCVEELGGFVYAAHVTQANGLLKQKLPHLWKDRRLRAAQISGPVDHLPTKYKPIALNQNPDYRRDPPMALINAKDVAKPGDLKDPRASCFIKMTRPCFESFQMAFKDPESRIRLADQMKVHYYSRIERIRIEGGYLDGLDIRLSDHLNTVIGGRGTGKSTLLECIRYALDIPHKGREAERQGNEIVKENLGNAGGRVILELCSANNNMKSYTIIRRYAEPPRVLDEHGNESALHPGKDLLPGIEIYGQNEIYELAKSPDALARVLDRFLPDSLEQQERLDLAYRKLKGNSERLLKALEQRDEIEQKIAQLPKLEEQVRQFKEQGLEEQLKLVPLLEKERQLSPRMEDEIGRVRDAVGQLQDSLPDLVFLNDKALDGLPHAELLRKGRGVLEALGKALREKLKEIEQAIDASSEALQQVVIQVQEALEDSERQLEKEFSKLPEVAGKDGKEVGRIYQRLLRKIEQIKPARTKENNIKALIKELEQERRNLLGEISDLRSARLTAKQKAVKVLNKRLKGKLRI